MKFAFFTASILWTALSFSVTETKQTADFVKISKDKSVYVDWVPAVGSQPTVVLLNGLTYSTKQWDRMTKALIKYGIGVVRYDMYGMGRTLLKDGPATAVIPYQDQVRDLDLLLKTLDIKAPYNLVGLSYGGGIAMTYAHKYPDKVGRLILMAPYTQPVEEQDAWIKSQIWLTRQTYPWNPASYDDLYDYFLHQLVYSTYPTAEPSAIENPYKLEAIYRMVQGIRKWQIKDSVSSFPKKSVHLMIAGADQYIKRHVMDEFWDLVPKKSKASMVVLRDSEHKIPEAVPVFAAAWISLILASDKTINNGTEFEADPETGVVKYDGGRFKIGKEN